MAVAKNITVNRVVGAANIAVDFKDMVKKDIIDIITAIKKENIVGEK